jgi:hypothetical protein
VSVGAADGTALISGEEVSAWVGVVSVAVGVHANSITLSSNSRVMAKTKFFDL